MTDAVSLTVPSRPQHLYVVRSALYPLVLAAGFTKKDARRIVLAVDEACSNIIKYAYDNDPSGTIELTMQDFADRFTVTLRDRGTKPDLATIRPRSLAEVRPGGLGTHIIGAVFDRVDYDTSRGEGTILTLEKRKQKVTA